MQTIRLKHLAAIRWFHWINFPLLAAMIWSGLLIYWAFPTYSLGPIHFFPSWVYSTFHMDHRLADGMALHFFFMWLFAINGLLYVLYTWVSGEWRYLLPRKRTALRDAWHVLLHDLHLRKAVPEQEKYNAAQQIAYTAIILMGAGSLITGLAIYKPAQLNWLTELLGGYQVARMLHFDLTVLYVLFFLVHVQQVLAAGWNNFRSMVSGWESRDEREKRPAS
ncbi:MAG: cytochrome b/b6 domain-containing protein [Acidobacteriaceae bacterium]|nr:cytochrome b/b6 domain-containing protein [Acidobacteriaceae bacterium]MBV9442096.1 cytochrome b/b6 domain-containing protein [Acidobacteriaceae bacterium]